MRISILGEALVLTSTLKVEEIKLLRKYKPDALKIKNENGDDLFAIAYKEGCSSITPKGVTFGGASRDGNEFATFTANISVAEGEDIKEVVADLIGVPAGYVSQIESAAVNALHEVRAARAELLNSITVL